MRKTIGVVVFLISVAVAGFAQVDTGSLVGTVKDPSGAALPGVTVTATNADTAVTTSAKTAPDGNYVITPLHIGRYSVSVEAPGFHREIRKDIVLDVQQTIRLDFSLKDRRGFGNNGSERSPSAARNRERIPGRRCDRRNG